MTPVGRPSSAARTWARTLASASPASRSSSVSPTQTIGSIPLRRMASIFLATTSSVSPKCWRRSECPVIT